MNQAGVKGTRPVDPRVRQHLMALVIDRMNRAVTGDTREEIEERYAPALAQMDEDDLKAVLAKTSSLTDVQLYLIDEKIHLHLQSKNENSPTLGSDVRLLFKTTIRS